MSYTHKNQIDDPSGIIDLGRGHPGPELLPFTLVRSAAEQRFAEGNVSLLQYGSEQGDRRFRTALATFLSPHYSGTVDPDTLLITNGASSALQLICTLFAKPGDTVFVEEPSYFLALRIFADHHLNVVSLPIDDEGMLVDALADHLEQVRPAFLYTVPTFQNPTGITMSADRRERLVALSLQYDLLVVADEVYHLLSYRASPPPSLATYSPSAHLISLGSFSKILAPGLRLGWLQTSPQLLERLMAGGLLQSGGGLNPFTSALVSSALESGRQDEHLGRLKRSYRERAESLDKALQKQMAELVHYKKAEGGYFIWLELPHGINAERLLEKSLYSGLRFQPGERFSSTSTFKNFVRLSFSYHNTTELAQGVERLRLSIGH